MAFTIPKIKSKSKIRVSLLSPECFGPVYLHRFISCHSLALLITLQSFWPSFYSLNWPNSPPTLCICCSVRNIFPISMPSWFLLFFFFIYFYQLEANYFTILQWFCHTLTCTSSEKFFRLPNLKLHHLSICHILFLKMLMAFNTIGCYLISWFYWLFSHYRRGPLCLVDHFNLPAPTQNICAQHRTGIHFMNIKNIMF